MVQILKWVPVSVSLILGTVTSAWRAKQPKLRATHPQAAQSGHNGAHNAAHLLGHMIWEFPKFRRPDIDPKLGINGALITRALTKKTTNS